MVFKSAKLTKAKQNKNQDFHHYVFNAYFPNHTLKLKVPDQPQSAVEESILTHDITSLLVQCIV